MCLLDDVLVDGPGGDVEALAYGLGQGECAVVEPACHRLCRAGLPGQVGGPLWVVDG